MMRIDPTTGLPVFTEDTQVVRGGGIMGGGGGSGTAGIPEYDTDPTSPAAEDAWVLRSGTVGTGGSPIGLLLALTKSGGGGYTYQFSYRTLENTTIRVPLT